jgi:hypothetical protein
MHIFSELADKGLSGCSRLRVKMGLFLSSLKGRMIGIHECTPGQRTDTTSLGPGLLDRFLAPGHVHTHAIVIVVVRLFVHGP